MSDGRQRPMCLCAVCSMRWLLRRRGRQGAMLPLLGILAISGVLPLGETGLDPATTNPLHSMLPPTARWPQHPCRPFAMDRAQACDGRPAWNSRTLQALQASEVLWSSRLGSLRLAGGGSGLGWIERRLNSVFSSASKASGSPSGCESVQSKENEAPHSDTTPDAKKAEMWKRFDRAFDSLQTENSLRQTGPRSMSPISSPEGPQQPAREREGSSSNKAAPATMNSWLSRRFSDAFASDAASPADNSHWSHLGWSAKSNERGSRLQNGDNHHRSLSSSSKSRALHGSKQMRQPPGQQNGADGQRFQSSLQQGSEISEEASGGEAPERSADTLHGERASSLADSFMLKMRKKLKQYNSVSESAGHSSIDDVGLPTPLRAEWGPALQAERRTLLDAGWELPSISLAVQDVAAAVVICFCCLPLNIMYCRDESEAWRTLRVANLCSCAKFELGPA